ncbi:hypothetical protein ACFZDG_24700 [Kitasatospora xanthocidica]|uniref:hypothetical protein n=1 Tax=Kitasatospora xanthocidica TaxID=83382 RepID=UPI0036E33473
MTTSWPDEATFACGERVALTTPDPPRAELGHLGAEILGTRGVVLECVVKALVSLGPTPAPGTTTG